ncbi:MAG: hypothetical protein WD652_06435 [Acidimicrobiia bacterium]
MRNGLLITLLVAATLTACSGDEGRVTGVLTAVDGDLTGVESFEIQSGGARLRFVPDDGLDVFGDDGTPLSHLFEHLQTGDPIRVTYRTTSEGNIATLIEDG